MLQRIRQFFHDSDVTVGVVAGVVGGLALIDLVHALVMDFVIPVCVKAFGQYPIDTQGLFNSNIPKALTFHAGGVRFDYTQSLAWALTFAIVAAILYRVFVWVREPSEQQELAMRECPECKSEIWADARRCRFCTSAVEPVQAAPAPEPARRAPGSIDA